MSILITGCAGFIGSHATDHFLDLGYSVVGVDCLTYAGSENNIKKALNNKNFKWYKNDICNTEDMIKYCSSHSIDWIINFAAETHVDNSILSCDRFIHSNILGVKSLLECCRKTGSKLFQISTDEVYGSCFNKSFVESDLLSPKNPYSATKASAEHFIQAYHNTYGVQYMMVRMSNNFGPRQHPEKFIPTILRSLFSGKKIPVYGDGKNVRDWFFVKDCVQMIGKILEKGEINQVYNLTQRNEKTNLDIVELICNLEGVNFEDSIEFVPDRLGHDLRYSICNKKALNVCKETKFYDFKESLDETIKFYKESME